MLGWTQSHSGYFWDRKKFSRFGIRNTHCPVYEIWEKVSGNRRSMKFFCFPATILFKKKTRLYINTQRNKEQYTSVAVCRLPKSSFRWALKTFFGRELSPSTLWVITGLTGVGSENNYSTQFREYYPPPETISHYFTIVFGMSENVFSCTYIICV